MLAKRRLPKSIEATKSAQTAVSQPRTAMNQNESQPGRRRTTRRILALVLGVAAIAAVAVFGFQQYRVFRVAQLVRTAFAAHRYEIAREPLGRWLQMKPASAEAHYYEAWGALANNQPREAVQAVDRARSLGFDKDRLDCLAAVYHARADRFSEAEPVLERAFLEQLEPAEMVAKELARIYLSTYRLDRAAIAVERWRALRLMIPSPASGATRLLLAPTPMARSWFRTTGPPWNATRTWTRLGWDWHSN